MFSKGVMPAHATEHARCAGRCGPRPGVKTAFARRRTHQEIEIRPCALRRLRNQSGRREGVAARRIDGIGHGAHRESLPVHDDSDVVNIR